MEKNLNLNVIIKGFQEYEHRIIATTVRLSKFRPPKVTLLPDSRVDLARVIIIDGRDRDAMLWAKDHYSEIKNKSTIWVDFTPPERTPLHVKMARPIVWVNLPSILTRLLDIQINKNIVQPSDQLESFGKGADHTPKRKSSILVVDDSKAVRESLLKLLSKKHYAATPASSGEEAIELVQRQEFDCVLMDVLMPGMDGYEACRQILRIKKNGDKLPVVMLTSRTSPFDKVRAKFAGCDAYLTKPVKVERLLNCLAKYENSQQGG